jgi:hypothetical protein
VFLSTGDVYSLGIIMQQLILRSAPYESSIESQRPDYLAHAKDLVMEVIFVQNVEYLLETLVLTYD